MSGYVEGFEHGKLPEKNKSNLKVNFINYKSVLNE